MLDGLTAALWTTHVSSLMLSDMLDFRWKFYDAMLRKERLSTLHMTREEAGQRLPGAVADLTMREVRYVPEDRDDFRPSALDRTH